MTLACEREFVTAPLIDAITERGWDAVPYEHGPRADAAAILREVDVVISSPLDYAATIGIVDYALVEGFSISIGGSSGLVRLLFNAGRENLESVAVRASNEYDRIVTQILLAEKHDLEPVFVEVDDRTSVTDMLSQADAAVVSGDTSLFGMSGIRTFLDVGDEWEDAVGETLPYRIAWGKVNEEHPIETDSLREARDAALLAFADRAATSDHPAEASALHQAYLRGDVSFELGEAQVRALETFYRYAYYHGVIHDIPSIKYL
jgi:predicted solute-binding protein